ncbi:MAG: AAA family ATPase [Candidatus Aenigmarchaeota archaeon]|nr:AAA family ATPase [Candidatus Aenigmarchaeota archaeon]
MNKPDYKDDFLNDGCPSPMGELSSEPEQKEPTTKKNTPPPKKIPLLGSAVIKNKKHIVYVESDDAVFAINAITAFGDNTIGATTLVDWKDSKHTNWDLLAGKTVYLWPDNLPQKTNNGKTFEKMLKVQGILTKLKPAVKIFWINPEDLDLPENGNVVEFLSEYENDENKIEQLHAVLANAYPLGPAGGVKKRIEDSISGKRKTIRLPWPELNLATQALKPGTVTLICGDGGTAKSFMLLQLAQFWHFELGNEVALYELEDDREYHLMRSIAQLTKEPGMTQEHWIKENKEKAREIYDENVGFFNTMGNMISDAPVESVNLKRLAEWVDEQARSGKRIICIDPITAATKDRDTWIQDLEFMSSTKRSIVETGASLVIVTHPKQGGGKSISSDNIAGGACWWRFSQTIMWIKYPGEDQEVEIIDHGCRIPRTCNRIISCIKARNSYGGGCNFAMNLDNLVFDEVGQMARKKKRGDDD